VTKSKKGSAGVLFVLVLVLVPEVSFAAAPSTSATTDTPAGDAAPVNAAPRSPDAEPPPDPEEMHFGRAAAPRAHPEASLPALPGVPDAPGRSVGRARTMEEVSNSSTEELDIRSVHWRYSLNFFGDVSLSGGHPTSPDHPLSFALGAQDILLKGELANHIVTSTEIAIEGQDDGSFGVDIERFNVRWQSPNFYVEAGRSHTEFGYWNNAYHHGKWLQLTIDRPRWVAFEDDGGLLPVHWVGLVTGAHFGVGSGTLNLVASVGNGRGKIVDDVRNSRDYQSSKALHAAVEVVGIGLPELRLGAAGVVSRIPPQDMSVRPALPDRSIDELIVSGHLSYASVPLLLIGETYAVVHRVDDTRWTTLGGFVLLGYAFGRVTPYLEFERIASRGGTDPFFNPGTASAPLVSFDTAEGIVGLRVDLSDWTALKAEYRATRAFDTSTNLQEGVIDWSWGF
jgi:hypothetical protein